MDQRGWVPATAGNLSVRVGADRIAITRSGVHKGCLTPADIILVDGAGRALTPGARPSAETGLHCQAYRLLPGAGCVLHGHSVSATVLSLRHPGPAVTLRGYELLKAFEGQRTHEAALDVPLFPNDQDIPQLAARVEKLLPAMRAGYLIRGHGAYVWGPDADAALWRMEALEFLLSCELEALQLEKGRPP